MFILQYHILRGTSRSLAPARSKFLRFEAHGRGNTVCKRDAARLLKSRLKMLKSIEIKPPRGFDSAGKRAARRKYLLFNRKKTAQKFGGFAAHFVFADGRPNIWVEILHT